MNIYLIIGLSLLTLCGIIIAFIFINKNNQGNYKGNNQDNDKIKDLKKCFEKQIFDVIFISLKKISYENYYRKQKRKND